MLSSPTTAHLHDLADRHQMTPSQYAATMTDDDYCWLRTWLDPDCVCPDCLTQASIPKLLDPDTDYVRAAREMKTFILSGQPLSDLDQLAPAAQDPVRRPLRERVSQARRQLISYLTGRDL